MDWVCLDFAKLSGNLNVTLAGFGFCLLAMSVDPLFGLLASGRDLRLCHLRSQPFELGLAVLVPPGQRDLRPHVGSGQIPGNPGPCPIVRAKRRLGGDIALFGSTQIPLHSLHVILRRALAVVIANAHLPLCVRVSLTGKFSQFWKRLQLRTLTRWALIGRVLIGGALRGNHLTPFR